MVERLLRVEKADEPTEIVIHVNMLKEGWDVKFSTPSFRSAPPTRVRSSSRASAAACDCRMASASDSPLSIA